MEMHDPLVLRRILALRRFPMFAHAEVGELAMLADNLTEQTFARGAVVARAGARPPALHLIVEGEITSGDRSWSAHEVFGVLAVLARCELGAPAIATRPTRTLQLWSSDLTEVLDESFGVLRATLRELAARIAVRAATVTAAVEVPPADPFGFVDRLIVLRQLPLLAGARLDALAMLAHTSEELHFPAGALVARAGEAATHAYVVLEGSLETTPGHVLGPGNTIGSLEMLSEQPHARTVAARTAVRVLATGASAFLDVLEDHTDLGLGMIASFATQLVERRAA